MSQGHKLSPSMRVLRCGLVLSTLFIVVLSLNSDWYKSVFVSWWQLLVVLINWVIWVEISFAIGTCCAVRTDLLTYSSLHKLFLKLIFYMVPNLTLRSLVCFLWGCFECKFVLLSWTKHFQNSMFFDNFIVTLFILSEYYYVHLMYESCLVYTYLHR